MVYSVRMANYHTLLENNKFLFLRYLLNEDHAPRMLVARNCLRENLLHVACKLNESNIVTILILLDYNPTAQDYLGRTPLHLALIANHIPCIEEFFLILRAVADPTTHIGHYNNSIALNLKKMFSVYDDLGYTVIHQAVIMQNGRILTTLLELCNALKINVLYYEILGSGDSLLHLAVNIQAREMQHIIVAMIPQIINVCNYAGERAAYVPEIIH